MSKRVEVAEGFICPYCLVSFNSSNKLQAHFIEFHSEENSDASSVLEHEEDEQSDLMYDNLGHGWKTHTLPKPRSCEACDVIIWSTSYICQECQMVIHPDQKCLQQVTKICIDDRKDNLINNQLLPRADAPPPPKAITDIVKRQVAKGRNRYIDDGFDLDLSYITERIIAMSFPSTGLESTYRNSLKDVAKMLKTRHQENYMVFNLSERSYDISKFNNQVLDFGWPDHLAPSLERLSIICKSMKSWLDSDLQHVVVVHCKGGKGRTGCVIAAFMHYIKICESATAALDYFAMKRFYDDKLNGVTQPSQRRYVHYFEDLLSGKINLDSPPVKLLYIIIHGIPNFDGKGGCRPFVKIYQNMELAHTSGLYVCTSDKDRVKISLYGGLKLEGEILIKCFHKRSTGVDSIFRAQFHHSVVQDHRVVWTKADLDDAFCNKKFEDDIKVELIFEPAVKKRGKTTKGLSAEEPEVDLRYSLLADRQLIEELSALSDKRNSYAAFAGGFDNGVSDLIQFDKRDRSSTSESDVMDPNLIQRIQNDNGNIYTVVSKENGAKSRDTSPVPLIQNIQQEEDLLSSIPKYSHLVHNREVLQPLPAKPSLHKLGQYSHLITSAHQSPGGGNHGKAPGRYDDVSTKKLVLTPASPTRDNQMRVKVNWQAKASGLSTDSMGSQQRSSSQTALDNLIIQEEYSNLADVFNGGGMFITQQGNSLNRRHSIGSSPTDKLNQHQSIIMINPAPQGAMVAPSNDDDYSTIPDEPDDTEDVYTIPPDAEGLYKNLPLPSEDYVNVDSIDMQHNYLNEAEIQEQLRLLDTPPTIEGIVPATVIQQKVPATGLNIIMENLRIKKPATKTVIQSSAVSSSDRQDAMPMFHLSSGNKGVLVGRGDYQQFDLDSWGGSKNKKKSSPPIVKRTPSPLELPPKPRPVELPNKPLPPKPSKPSVSPKLSQKPMTPGREPPPKPPYPSESIMRAHRPIQHSKSHSPSEQQQQQQQQQHIPKSTKFSPPSVAVPTKPSPPPRPSPYQKKKSSPPPNVVAQVKDMMSHWYHPAITRDDACELVKKMDDGCFIVRDSQTVSGGYALTIKVSVELMRQRKKIADDIEITADMCVTHFLIQPDPEGVKLQGWDEPAFKTLPDFIAKHTMEKLCLPCILKLPKDSSHHQVKKKDQVQLISAAACDLILLGSIEVLHSMGEGPISEAARQLKALGLHSATVVNFKASVNGLTITDNSNGILTKRNYPINCITFCGLGPNDIRWNLSHLGIPASKSCFGIIHKMLDAPGYLCLLFTQFDPSQPVLNIVSFVKKLINQSKLH